MIVLGFYGPVNNKVMSSRSCKQEFGWKNITTVTVINVKWAGGDHTSPWNAVHAADKFSMFDLNVQNKPTSSKWNSVTVLLLTELQYGHNVIDLSSGSNGGYLQSDITPHKFMLNTWIFWVNRRKIGNDCYINFISVYESVLTLQQKST